MKNATFIDFEDSFSYNVVQELNLIGFHVTVINWRDFDSLPSVGVLVLGPGPGHPDDYQQLFPMLKIWLEEKRPFFGVCLGHQIFWRLMGEEVLRSKEPLHGQKVKLQLTAEWQEWLGVKSDIFVQRYNSLAVMGQASVRNPYLTNFIQNDEILITRGENVLTYQFHPESIGTSYRSELMRPVYRDLV